MSYVICQEMGRLTLFHYYLDLDGKFYVATNSARKFPTKSEAMNYARALPQTGLYIQGPRKGTYKVRGTR